MKYRGYDIEETRNVTRYEEVRKYTNDYSNEIELGIEELDELKEIIRKKEAELKEKGVRFSSVKIEMTGIDEQYNPNGADYKAEFTTNLSWIEEESEEEREKRIQREREIIANNCPHWNECTYPCKNCPTFKKMFKSCHRKKKDIPQTIIKAVEDANKKSRLLYLLWRYLPTLLTILLNFVKPKPFTTNSDGTVTSITNLKLDEYGE